MANPNKENRHLTLISFCLISINLASAFLFIVLVDTPVFDDLANSRDVLRYAQQGLTTDAIKNHINPAGPGSYLWMAAASVVSEDLRTFRLAILLSWCLLIFSVFMLNKSSIRMACSILLPSIVFPHSVMAMATMLTEGPALLFATVGTLCWLNGVKTPNLNNKNFALSAIGALLIGLSIIFRQYYIALLPAMLLTGIYTQLHRGQTSRIQLSITFIKRHGITLAIAVIPLICLIMVWDGFTSPGMRSGATNNGVHAFIALNPWRPLSTFFYLCMYIMPLTISLWFQTHHSNNMFSIVSAITTAILIFFFGELLIQEGPVRSIGLILNEQHQNAGRYVLSLLSGLSIYNLSLLINAAIKQREVIKNSLPIKFSLLFLSFFVLQNAFIGGEINYYERYTLQAAPFLGIIAFSLSRSMHSAGYVILILMALLSNMMLWRFAL